MQLPYPPNVDVAASVVPSSVSTPVYVYLVDPAGVLVLGKQTITKDSAGHYSTKLLFNQSLPAGTYTGKLQLQICQDAACATPYAVTGGTLPYTVTVTPAIAISAKINSVAVASSGISVKDGDTLTLQSNVTVTWSPSQNNVTSGGIAFTNVATSSNMWTATLKPALGSSGTTLSTSILATQYVTGQATPYANKMTPITLVK